MDRHPLPPPPPKVVFVGGPDVDARLELMHCLSASATMSALGSRPGLRERFRAEGFAYAPYLLSRRVNPVVDLVTLGQLTLLFRRLRPQIVHAFDTKPGVWGCLAARLAGVPVVVGTLTGLGALYASDRLGTRVARGIYQALQALTCRLSDLTVFQNPDDARQFIASGVVPSGKAMVIPGSGVSTEAFDPASVSEADRNRVRRELGVQPEDTVVTMISRVIRSKGVLEFMAAALDAATHSPRVRWVLVGPEDHEAADRLTAAELARLKRTVTWAGPRQDIPAVLAATDIFALPSAYREGVPRVLVEAASMGLPIVTTDSPGCNAVVEDGVNGFLIPAHDPRALGQAIGRLVADPELRHRFGAASRRRAVEGFSLSRVADLTSSVYRRLLARKDLDRRSRAPTGGKRAFDIAFSACVLLATFPLILLGALGVKFSSPGPTFYRAKRAGVGGRPFTMYKLRTMRVGADAPSPRITAPRDGRVTPIGSVLRKFRIDELPQFWNVLRGDMSIVGPRPEDWEIVRDHYTPEQRRTLEVRPGVVSTADVRWYPDLSYHDPPPAGTSVEQHYVERHLPVQLAEGLRYVERQNLFLDLKVIGQAVFCVVVRSWLPPKKRPVPSAGLPARS